MAVIEPSYATRAEVTSSSSTINTNSRSALNFEKLDRSNVKMEVVGSEILVSLAAACLECQNCKARLEI
jgi:hypothetical protein